MKPTWILMLMVLSLCTCQSDKTVSPEDYDGEYPYSKGSGKPFKAYQVKFLSSWSEPPITDTVTPVPAEGKYSLMFKDHEWNHWPYMLVGLQTGPSKSFALDNIKGKVFYAYFIQQALFDCYTERVNFGIPAQTGRHRFGQNVSYTQFNPSFSTIDCDTGKDRIVADTTANNWVNITRLDSLTNQVEGSFDLSFKITRKDVTYPIIYPTHIRIRGSFNGPFKNR